MIRTRYIQQCRARWGGWALSDALSNWHGFEEIRETLIEAMRIYHLNPFLEDLAGNCHNSDGRLTSFLWQLQEGIQPDKRRLDPLLDFEEHFQKVFLRRGLVIYCTILSEELEEGPAPIPGDLNLFPEFDIRNSQSAI